MRLHRGLFPFHQRIEISMKIKLSQPFASNGKVDEFDVRQMKKALNRLGYYQPYEKTGITGIPDTQVFTALKAFQKDHGLTPTGEARPNDETVKSLSSAATKKKDGQYIWRTVGDDRVRESHAELSGTVRDFADSPDPGEEFNCRCWAEPITEAPGLAQKLTSEIKDAGDQWSDVEFVWHFYFGGGEDKTLSEIGLLGAVIERAEEIMLDHVKAQVANAAIARKAGAFSGSWNNSYNFKPVVYSLGGVTIRGRFSGTADKEGNVIHVKAKAYYEFYDEFTDPTSVREKILGTSEVAELPASLLGGAVLLTTDLAGTAYRITGGWQTEITGSISIKE